MCRFSTPDRVLLTGLFHQEDFSRCGKTACRQPDKINARRGGNTRIVPPVPFHAVPAGLPEFIDKGPDGTSEDVEYLNNDAAGSFNRKGKDCGGVEGVRKIPAQGIFRWDAGWLIDPDRQ